MLSTRSSISLIGRPTSLESIPATMGTLTAQNLEPKLPPALIGRISSWLLGTVKVLATMKRKCVKVSELQ